jgi:hypothetical protein
MGTARGVLAYNLGNLGWTAGLQPVKTGGQLVKRARAAFGNRSRVKKVGGVSERTIWVAETSRPGASHRRSQTHFRSGPGRKDDHRLEFPIRYILLDC